MRVQMDSVHRDRRRPRQPLRDHLRSSSWSHVVLVRWAATADSFVDPGCCVGRTMWRSRGNLCSLYSWFCGRRATALELSCCEGWELQKGQRSVRLQAGLWPVLRRAGARPIFRRPCSPTWKDLLAGWPPSKSVELRPFQHRTVQVLRRWGCTLPRESRGVQHCTKLALCLGPVLGSGAVDSPPSQSALSRQKAMRLPVANPSGLA